MNIRDLNPMHDPIGFEGLVAYGIDPLLHFAELLRETFDEDYEPDCSDTMRELTAQRLFFTDESIQRLKDLRDCLRRVDAGRYEHEGTN